MRSLKIKVTWVEIEGHFLHISLQKLRRFTYNEDHDGDDRHSMLHVSASTLQQQKCILLELTGQ